MPPRSIVIPGTVFGRLTVLDSLFQEKKTRCLVRCECGKEKIVAFSSLKAGATKSCGCMAVDVLKTLHATHGARYTSAYSVWASMLDRTTRQNHKHWGNYGGRGITVCERWLVFENFLEDMGQPPKGMQLDREKNHLGYSKQNCRWVTRSANNRNRRNNTLVDYKGELMCLVEAAERSGISRGTLHSRMKKGQTGATLFRPVWPAR